MPGATPGPVGGPPPTPPGAVPTYLVQSILVTLFCCIPFGIVAIVKAAGVSSALAAGDYQKALAASQSARTWCWVAFGVGLAVSIVGIVLQFALAAAGG
jgi:hypothetical protein